VFPSSLARQSVQCADGAVRFVGRHYDLAAAQAARADEIINSDEELEALAHKAAQQERSRWESNETKLLRKQFAQPPLSPELDLDVKVPLGDDTAVLLGEMNRERIRIRKDLRTQSHLNEIRAFDVEMTYWQETESVLDADETISEAIHRGDEAA